MGIVVIGGQARKVGKTSVVCGLIAAMPERRWVAIKISPDGHGLAADELVGVTEQGDAASGTDTARYLAAGAARAFWVRVREGRLGEAMPRIRELIEGAEGDVILESNSVMEFLRPEVYGVVLDANVADFKVSAERFLDRADAVLWTAGSAGRPDWSADALRQIEGIAGFEVGPPRYFSPEFAEFVAGRCAN